MIMVDHLLAGRASYVGHDPNTVVFIRVTCKVIIPYLIDCRGGQTRAFRSVASQDARLRDCTQRPHASRRSRCSLMQAASSWSANAQHHGPGGYSGLDGGFGENCGAESRAVYELGAQRSRCRNAKQSVLAFKGDVYTGLEANTLSTEELAFAQKHLRILSGLYGLLRPLDLMQPYRLEMGLPFENAGGKNLYEFWGDQITETLGKHLKASGSPVLVNLASNEYFKAVKPKLLDAEVITPQFRDLKNGQYKMISFFAKKARGLMARYIIQEGLTEPRRAEALQW